MTATRSTLCGEADESCPALAGDVRRVHWPLPDPSAVPEAERLEAGITAELMKSDYHKWTSGLTPAGKGSLNLVCGMPSSSGSG